MPTMEELFDGSAAEATASTPETQAPPADVSTEPEATQQSPAPETGKEQLQAAPPAGKDEGAPPAPGDQERPDSAYGRLRKERNEARDQLTAEKVERARLEERLAAAERQRVANSPPPARQAAVPNPVEDPEGYAVHQQRVIYNERLNISEAMLLQQHDKADVEATLAAFKAEADKNPAWGAQLGQQAHPYGWAYEQGKRLLAMQEIGADPVAYKAKIEADLRAKWESEQAAAQPPSRSPVPTNLPPSLGKVANAGSRMGAAYSGPTPIEDLF